MTVLDFFLSVAASLFASAIVEIVKAVLAKLPRLARRRRDKR